MVEKAFVAYSQFLQTAGVHEAYSRVLTACLVSPKSAEKINVQMKKAMPVILFDCCFKRKYMPIGNWHWPSLTQV
jgi:hypothetical protein